MEQMTGASDSAPTSPEQPHNGHSAAPAAPGYAGLASGRVGPDARPLSPSETLDQAIDAVVADQQVQATDQAIAAALAFDIDHPRVIEPVKILIDGTLHRLRLPLRSIKRFQQATGKSIWDHETVWSWPPDPDNLVHLLWAALLWEWPDLTVDQVEQFDLFEFGQIHYLRHCLNDCWGQNQPQQLDGPSANGSDPNRLAQPLGARSGG